jgi:steroid 5-alpha reductase family enzyme
MQSPGNWPAGARLPIPGNAEWFWWAVMAVLIAIVALAADTVGAAQWVDFMKWTTSAYLLARGIAKASRVLEQ